MTKRFQTSLEAVDSDLVLEQFGDEFRRDTTFPNDENAENLETRNLILNFSVLLDEDIIITERDVFHSVRADDDDLFFCEVGAREHGNEDYRRLKEITEDYIFVALITTNIFCFSISCQLSKIFPSLCIFNSIYFTSLKPFFMNRFS
jgi:hypothetical protein